jgi:hypothetical protein
MMCVHRGGGVPKKSNNHQADDADADHLVSSKESAGDSVLREQCQTQESTPQTRDPGRFLVSAKDTTLSWESVINHPTEHIKSDSGDHVQSGPYFPARESRVPELAGIAGADTGALIHFKQLLKEHGLSGLAWRSSLMKGIPATGEPENYYISDQVAGTIELEHAVDDTADGIDAKISRRFPLLRRGSKSRKKRLTSDCDGVKPHSPAASHDSTVTSASLNSDRQKSQFIDSQLAQGASKNWVASEKRFVLGSEIALAVIIAAAGAARLRVRTEKTRPRPELIPGGGSTGDAESRRQAGESAADIDGADQKISIEHTSSSDGEISVSNSSERLDSEQYLSEGTTVKPANPRTRPKTIIASTDTLVSLAEAFFYDRNVAWLIADLNKGVIKESWLDGKRIVELKSRQQIELPLREDIERFYRQRADHALAENLITIVEQAGVDSQLLSNSLAKLLEPEQE